MDDVIAWLLRNGRLGGIVSVLIGLGIALVVLLDVTATGGFFVIMPPAAVVRQVRQPGRLSGDRNRG